MKVARLFLIVMVIGCSGKEDPMPADVNEYLTILLKTMEENHINRKSIDWAAFRSEVLAKAKGARSIKDTYPAVTLALTNLGDNISYVKYESFLVISDPTKQKRCSNGYNSFKPVGYVSGINYLDMYPRFTGNDPSFEPTGSAGDQLATNFQAIIKNNDTADRAGWMLDFRRTRGNNLWVMLAALGPILGNGVAGYFIDQDGNEVTYEYNNGNSLIAGARVMNTVANPYTLVNPQQKVAILIDGETSGSTEAMVLAFRGKANVKIFGQSTCGVTMRSTPFLLADYSTLMLATHYITDRNKTNALGAPVNPDVVADPYTEVVDVAAAWLREP